MRCSEAASGGGRGGKEEGGKSGRVPGERENGEGKVLYRGGGPYLKNEKSEKYS